MRFAPKSGIRPLLTCSDHSRSLSVALSAFQNFEHKSKLSRTISLSPSHQFLGECHVRAERVQVWSTWCPAGRDKAVPGLLQPTLGKCDCSQREVSLVNQVPATPAAAAPARHGFRVLSRLLDFPGGQGCLAKSFQQAAALALVRELVSSLEVSQGSEGGLCSHEVQSCASCPSCAGVRAPLPTTGTKRQVPARATLLESARRDRLPLHRQAEPNPPPRHSLSPPPRAIECRSPIASAVCQESPLRRFQLTVRVQRSNGTCRATHSALGVCSSQSRSMVIELLWRRTLPIRNTIVRTRRLKNSEPISGRVPYSGPALLGIGTVVQQLPREVIDGTGVFTRESCYTDSVS